jgi:hypothetical protein
MKLLRQSHKTKSRRPVKRLNRPGMRLRTGVKAGAGSMVYDDVLWNRPPDNERPLP